MKDLTFPIGRERSLLTLSDDSQRKLLREGTKQASSIVTQRSGKKHDDNGGGIVVK